MYVSPGGLINVVEFISIRTNKITKTLLLLTYRPTELCENPEMIYAISSFSIKQVSQIFSSLLFPKSAKNQNSNGTM